MIPQVVLVEPEIPQNTGNLARCTAANRTALHLIEPLGFEINEKNVKRAGLDYWPQVQLNSYKSWQLFLEKNTIRREQLWFFTTKTNRSYWDVNYSPDDYLVFGSEGKGLAPEFHEKYADRLVNIPLPNEHVRSLNLANAVSIALYETKRQLERKAKE